jgi:RNA polymerase primary sigma factor
MKKNDEENQLNTKSSPPDSINDNGQLEDIDDMVRLYCKQAVVLPLLTREEEVELAKQIEEGHEARKKLLSGKVQSHENKSLTASIVQSNQAFEKLIASNFRLVINIAKWHMGRGLSFLDLIQEGNIGLIRAAKRFDYRKGNKFSTYATWWIRQAISRAIANQGRTIRLPAYLIQESNKINIARHELRQSLGREPSLEEISDHIDASPNQIEDIIKFTKNPFSLDKPVYVEEDSVFGDFIEDKNTAPPEEEVSTHILCEQLDQILTRLPARDRKIIEMRFGMNGYKRHTLHEIGERIGVTRERIRQLELRSLNRLRSPYVLKKLQDYVEVV